MESSFEKLMCQLSLWKRVQDPENINFVISYLITTEPSSIYILRSSGCWKGTIGIIQPRTGTVTPVMPAKDRKARNHLCFSLIAAQPSFAEFQDYNWFLAAHEDITKEFLSRCKLISFKNCMSWAIERWFQKFLILLKPLVRDDKILFLKQKRSREDELAYDYRFLFLGS